MDWFTWVLALGIPAGVMAWAYFFCGDDGKQRVKLALIVSGIAIGILFACFLIGDLKNLLF